ncbi:predicted protein [Naegleria gruberi]|uniref:Predicted protein n=1 Tax=Naegleria gruberi TaxID=5762 RepID=D2VZH4_NAEGR|nr:uncharacterized protein NAEGRDRAFT_53497 [Naegleria gruberi]EFC37847.1 predicted protein [Naegleria gruberi]|eukprot:XP_002670591.1 predicted protein [Naegleria gruberi strain NEG-M]
MSNNNNNTLFDEIICNSILLFLPPKDWRISKPFLISSKFSLVCSSEEFAKQFLINLFKLSSEQVEQLEKACLMMYNNSRSLLKPRKKKRKIHHDDDDDEANEKLGMNRIAKSMREVLWIYFEMCSAYDSESIKWDVIERLKEFHKGTVHVLETAQEELMTLQLESYLLKSFNYFTSEEPQRIMTRSKDFIISEKVLLKIFGNVKDLFLIATTANSTEINLCLFTSFGYPLFFKSEYFSMSHGSIKEKLDVFGKHVFMHQLSHGDATDKFDKEMLATLQELLFSKNVDEVLVKEGKIPEKDLTDVKLSLLYEFLQCCFGKNGTMFRRFSLGWVPFVGKVRLVVREVGSTDFGSSSEEEDDEDDDEEYQENADTFSDSEEEPIE